MSNKKCQIVKYSPLSHFTPLPQTEYLANVYYELGLTSRASSPVQLGHLVIECFSLSCGRSSFLGRILIDMLSKVILLARAVDCNFDGNFTSLDLLTMHFANSFGLKSFGPKGNETEAATLAGLAAGLKLLDHIAGDGTERNL